MDLLYSLYYIIQIYVRLSKEQKTPLYETMKKKINDGPMYTDKAGFRDPAKDVRL